MTDRIRLSTSAVLIVALAACSGGPAGAPVAASTFPVLAVPPDASFYPYRCSGTDAGDPVSDPITGGGARDIVGDDAYPAFYRAMDATDVYFRMRVSGDPRKPGNTTELQPSSWDVLVDVDGDLSTYEYMLTADGNLGITDVQWVENTIPEPTNPSDPAETVLADLTPATDHWAVQPTGDGSSFGGDPDFFITLAIPRALLVAAGLDLTKPFVAWAGTNAQTYALNSDFGCYVGIPPTLGDAANDPGYLDPTGHPDAVADSVTTEVGRPVTTAVLANDLGLEDAPIAVAVESPPAHGTAAVHPDGTITYTPVPGFLGSDAYTYRIADRDGEADIAVVTVTVSPLGDVPGVPEGPVRDGLGVRGGGCASGPGSAVSLLLLGAAAWLRRRGANH